MTLPESKNIKLPDTIGEAEQIQNDVNPENDRNPAWNSSIFGKIGLYFV